MNWQDHIGADPNVLVGKPVIKGTRLSVEFVLDLIAQGWAEDEIARSYRLEREQIRACADFARARVAEEKFFTLAA